jgi:thiamine biosynthesis protein ThiI
MMDYKYVVIRYGEIGTKGKNKKDFIKCLYNNIKNSLKKNKNLRFYNRYDRLYVELNGENPKDVYSSLDLISGISSYSPCYFVNRNIDDLKDNIKEIIKNVDFKTFKIDTKRADKTFEIESMEVNKIIAGVILKSKDVKVDVHEPETKFNIEIRNEGIYVYYEKYKGLGGYPLGVGGKALVLLSGGIDSPVACFEMMKRGVTIECIHFASFPYTSKAAEEKVFDLARKLNALQSNIKLHMIPFTKLQEAIYENVDESYAITIMRRMMYRISEQVARRNNCLALVSGESIGQVASQTLNSMQVINEVTSFPMIRPLACFDKLEIIDISKKIDTYDISIRPFEDCCTIFTPKNPVTKPNLETAINYENKFDYEGLIEEIMKNINTITINNDVEESEYF